VVVLKSLQMGKFMNQNVSGTMVPDSWIEQIGAVAKMDRKKKAPEMMGTFIKEIKSMVQGVYIMPLGWTDIIPQILEYAEIKVAKHLFFLHFEGRIQCKTKSEFTSQYVSSG
jgi:methylenetetrahydrofolate reductase (NADPH)